MWPVQALSRASANAHATTSSASTPRAQGRQQPVQRPVQRPQQAPQSQQGHTSDFERFLRQLGSINVPAFANDVQLDQNDAAHMIHFAAANQVPSWLITEQALASMVTASNSHEYADGIGSRLSDMLKLLQGLKPRSDAQEECEREFPYGHDKVPTSGKNLLCGFEEVIHSMKATHPSLPPPTLESLTALLNLDHWREYAASFGMEN